MFVVVVFLPVNIPLHNLMQFCRLLVQFKKRVLALDRMQWISLLCKYRNVGCCEWDGNLDLNTINHTESITHWTPHAEENELFQCKKHQQSEVMSVWAGCMLNADSPWEACFPSEGPCHNAVEKKFYKITVLSLLMKKLIYERVRLDFETKK